MNERYRVLIVDDDPEDTEMVKILAERAAFPSIEFTEAHRLEKAFVACRDNEFDIVLLDLVLPDSSGMQTLQDLVKRIIDIPVVVLSGLNDEEVGFDSILKGAQDFIPKDELNENVLIRSIRFSVERFRLVKKLRELTLTDKLTSLKNRRGFFDFSRQALSLANRNKRGCVLLYGDVDGLKDINDKHGHAVGDAVLATVGATLKQTTRSSDVVARISGDEFVILMLDADMKHSKILIDRFNKTLSVNQAKLPSVPLSMSIGCSKYDPENPVDLESLMKAADKDMYQNKRAKN